MEWEEEEKEHEAEVEERDVKRQGKKRNPGKIAKEARLHMEISTNILMSTSSNMVNLVTENSCFDIFTQIIEK